MSAREHRQAAVVLELLSEMLPHVREDRNLPARIQHRLAADKRFGSRDRRLYRELLYTAIRHLPWVEQILNDTNRPLPSRQAAVIHLLAQLATRTPGSTVDFIDVHKPEPPDKLPPFETLLPVWFGKHIALPDVEIQKLHTRAPLWIRLNSSQPSTLLRSELAQLNASLTPSGVLPDAYQVPPDTRLTATRAYHNGDFEIQDLGSQLILAGQDADIFKGLWLDACAGAGGKALQLARLLPRTSLVHAHDIRPGALEELRLRAQRTRTPNIRILTPEQMESIPAATYDGVLVDAPCSGLGTLRRSPHLKWTVSPIGIRLAAETQLNLLSRFSVKLREGGILIYATCSITRDENESVVAQFLEKHPGFELLQERTLLPSEHDTDAYYTATLRLKNVR